MVKTAWLCDGLPFRTLSMRLFVTYLEHLNKNQLAATAKCMVITTMLVIKSKIRSQRTGASWGQSESRVPRPFCLGVMCRGRYSRKEHPYQFQSQLPPTVHHEIDHEPSTSALTYDIHISDSVKYVPSQLLQSTQDYYLCTLLVFTLIIVQLSRSYPFLKHVVSIFFH